MLLFFFARKILSLRPLYVHVRTCEPLLLITVIRVGDGRCLGGVWIVSGLERQALQRDIRMGLLAKELVKKALAIGLLITCPGLKQSWE